MPRKRLGAVRRIVKLIMASPAGSSAACIRVSHAAPHFGKGPTLRRGPNTYFTKEGWTDSRAKLEPARTQHAGRLALAPEPTDAQVEGEVEGAGSEEAEA